MGRKLHIGVLCTSYPRQDGDPAGGFVFGLNRYLHKEGHGLTVVAAGEGPETIGPLGEHIHRVPSWLFYEGGAPEHLFGSFSRQLLAGSEALRFSAALLLAARRLSACDVLLSHFVVPCGAIGVILARGRPHLAIAHSSDVHLLRRLHLGHLLVVLSRRADLVYTDRSLRVPGAPGRIQPMGIECADFRPRGDRDGIRARLRLRGKTALFLGRLVPVKGVSGLLLALSSVPGLDLLIAGDGPERRRLEELALPLLHRVRFLGEVRGAARADLLAAADVLVLPSLRLPDGRTEGAPTVLMEAMAAGCPIVASDVGGARTLLGEAGILAPPGDVEGLAAALLRAMEDPPAPRWKAQARAAAHDWSAVGPALLARVAATEHPG